MTDNIILYNTADGKQEAVGFSVNYTVPPGASVIWNTVTHGPFRFIDDALLENHGIYQYDIYEDGNFLIAWQVGMWVKKFGPNAIGQPGTIPYLDGYKEGGANPFNYIPSHWQWLLDHHRKTVSLYALKGWLYQMPGSIYTDVNSAIEATYATTPLNKIRWEQKEFVPFGGVIFNIVMQYINETNFEVFMRFDSWLDRDYNDGNEDGLT